MTPIVSYAILVVIAAASILTVQWSELKRDKASTSPVLRELVFGPLSVVGFIVFCACSLLAMWVDWDLSHIMFRFVGYLAFLAIAGWLFTTSRLWVPLLRKLFSNS